MTTGITQVIHVFVRRWHLQSAWYSHEGWGEQVCDMCGQEDRSFGSKIL